MADSWADGDAYERFMGRWSRRLAPDFVRWLHAPSGLRWIDAGCGSGALSSAVLGLASPASVLGVDPSAGFIEEARSRIDDERVSFEVMPAEDLPADLADVAVSGLMLNFTTDPLVAVNAMARAAPGGVVGAYVWDYGGRMEMLRTFWDVAISLDAAAIDPDESHRFAVCEPGALPELWARAGLTEVRTGSLEMTMEFRDFDDLWEPFLGGAGPAPAYVATLEASARDRLREALQRLVNADPDGQIRLQARVWAVCGKVV